MIDRDKLYEFLGSLTYRRVLVLSMAAYLGMPLFALWQLFYNPELRTVVVQAVFREYYTTVNTENDDSCNVFRARGTYRVDRTVIYEKVDYHIVAETTEPQEFERLCSVLHMYDVPRVITAE